MSETLESLAMEWSEAIDAYRNSDAREIGKRLIPLLESVGATNVAKAVQVGRMKLWVWTVANTKEIERMYMLD